MSKRLVGGVIGEVSSSIIGSTVSSCRGETRRYITINRNNVCWDVSSIPANGIFLTKKTKKQK